MKTADLYIRVSTDEQADKGYSQRSQEEVLRRYCEINKINVRKVIYEDHSAKTFQRPQWQALLVKLKKTKGRHIDLILFTKWDRFSRNAGDAYQMMNILNALGVEPQAIEQPLDLSIPENKMMLAIYLAAPEVENDRRALNVFHGMRRARKEGRWMASAPVGYVNKTAENGRKYIGLKSPQSDILKWCFEKLATGEFSTEQIWKVARQRGLTCGKNNFLIAIRNPVYYGMITIPKYKNEDSYLVKGQHEPLITEKLFNDVQDALDGRKRKPGIKIMSPEELPLRGFLLCSRCSRLLTGSASKGRNQYYYYYHCSSQCGCRYKADNVNVAFVKGLKKFALAPEMTKLVTKVLVDIMEQETNGVKDDRKNVLREIDEQNDRLRKARELMLTGKIDPEDYGLIKKETQVILNKLEAKITEQGENPLRIDILLPKAVETIASIHDLYQVADNETKRAIAGSMYPEKMHFDGEQHRTARTNEVAEAIYMISSWLRDKKRRASTDKSALPTWVRPPGLEPGTKRL
ncbi:recombinase family protein [Mucilaginibacter sp. UR6-1]|uniref:recombinase family protein n=1 Tax=Mucilaginibacter sp. UR6-1 TaxID=1435643 RepID=UPI001E305CA0|nr:recombinase family protein [Mucilaginibacter sp. UR6-1]MCC8409067.1 recombinase family protein [Mucilaginibacter sp. UR6-1]